MERRLVFGFAVWMLVLAGCGSNSSTDSADSSSSAPPMATASNGPNTVNVADPAAQVAHQFLEAVVKGDTAQASALLTPLAKVLSITSNFR